jgi:uncharacterized protein
MAEKTLINFVAVWDRVIKEFQCDLESIHGPDHWRRVEQSGLRIAASNGAIVDMVRLFAVFRDSRRQDDGEDLGHGERGAAYAASLRGTLFDLTDVRMKSLYEACRRHTHGELSEDPTIGACWDADRLDLTRVGYAPRAKFMSTKLGRNLCTEA